MANANDSPTPAPEDRIAGETSPADAVTSIQALPPAPEQVVPEPPPAPREPLTPERLAEETRRLDWGVAVVVLILTFFLGSFAAHNSDIWMHLATGRLIAQGTYSFGSDPFSYTTANARWVNHSWLSDLVLYELAGAKVGEEPALNGAQLVAFKAILLAAMAWVMLLIRRPLQGFWIPAACVAVAVVAMSPRFLLQTTCVSYLFLALTLYLLAGPGRREATPAALQPGADAPRLAASLSRLWLIPPLFALWVNLDSWFLLGPVVVGLYLLGQVVQQSCGPGRLHDSARREDALRPGELRRLAMVFAAGLVACLLNPYHVHAFTLPTEVIIGLWPGDLREDPMFRAFQSPLDFTYMSTPGLGLNAAGLAYYPLALLGLISFGLNFEQPRWWRVLVWVPFFLLSLWLTRLIPFFAVVAAPIAALNFQDYAARQFGTAPRVDGYWKQWSLGGRIATLAAGLALLFVAWPGWLHPFADEYRSTRQVAWTLKVDPSWRQTAAKLRELHETWRQAGLPEDQARGLHFLPETAHYCAWFAPEEKGFFDTRFQLFPEPVAKTFFDLRKALRDPKAYSVANSPAWKKLVEDGHYRINHIVLSSSEQSLLTVPGLPHMWADSRQWTWYYMDGRSAVVGWKDPEKSAGGDSVPATPLDTGRLAFAPNRPESARSPKEAPTPPQPRTFWSSLTTVPPARPLELDETAMYLAYHEAMGSLWPDYAQLVNWIGLGVIPAANAPAGSGATLPLCALNYMPYPASGPAGANFLAVRAARRAIRASPNYAEAYQSLAMAYRALRREQEGRQGNISPLLKQLRQVQLVTALRHALTLKPESIAAHQMLAEVYMEIRDPASSNLSHLDLALEEWREALNALRAAPPRRGRETDEQFQQREGDYQERLKNDDERLKELEKEINLQIREDRYEVQAEKKAKHSVEKAGLALSQGLAKKALETLETQESAPQKSKAELELLLYLLLSTGQASQIDKEPIAVRDVNGWFAVLLWAAVGDYQKADSLLDQIIRQKEQQDTFTLLALVRSQTFQGATTLQGLNELKNIALRQQELADLRVIRGLLALESGETGTAAEEFRRATYRPFPTDDCVAIGGILAAGSPLEQVVLWHAGVASSTRQRFEFTNRPIAVRYLKLLQAHGH